MAAFSDTPHRLLPIVLKTCGLREGMRTAESFTAFYGIDPRTYPKLFHVGAFVGLTDEHRRIYAEHCYARRRNLYALVGAP